MISVQCDAVELWNWSRLLVKGNIDFQRMNEAILLGILQGTLQHMCGCDEEKGVGTDNSPIPLDHHLLTQRTSADGESTTILLPSLVL